MATKIRLQRHGKKSRPFYYIVVADARAPRDGKFIDRLGSYNPNTNPATIEINFEKAVQWVGNGAQPTDTTRTLLSTKGVMYKHHLNGGIAKGALTQEQADEKFATWLEAKTGKTQSQKDGLLAAKQDVKNSALVEETKKKEAMAAAIIAKNTPVVEEVIEEEAPLADTEVETTTETTEEAKPEA